MTRPDVVLTEACRSVRAEIGPVAWVVLEELVLSNEDGPRPGGGTVEVVTTVRDLAAAVGLSKDTVAAALRRLTKQGFVTRVNQRDRRSGCFGSSVYCVTIAGTGLRTSSPDGPKPDPDSTDTAVSSPEPRRRPPADEVGPERRSSRRPPPAVRTGADAADGQLSLLDAVESALAEPPA